MYSCQHTHAYMSTAHERCRCANQIQSPQSVAFSRTKMIRIVQLIFDYFPNDNWTLSLSNIVMGAQENNRELAKSVKGSYLSICWENLFHSIMTDNGRRGVLFGGCPEACTNFKRIGCAESKAMRFTENEILNKHFHFVCFHGLYLCVCVWVLVYWCVFSDGAFPSENYQLPTVEGQTNNF